MCVCVDVDVGGCESGWIHPLFHAVRTPTSMPTHPPPHQQSSHPPVMDPDGWMIGARGRAWAWRWVRVWVWKWVHRSMGQRETGSTESMVGGAGMPPPGRLYPFSRCATWRVRQRQKNAPIRGGLGTPPPELCRSQDGLSRSWANFPYSATTRKSGPKVRAMKKR